MAMDSQPPEAESPLTDTLASSLREAVAERLAFLDTIDRSPGTHVSKDDSDLPPPDIDADLFQNRLDFLRADEAARQVRRAEQRGSVRRPAFVQLRALLAEPEIETKWRISGLWPAGGRVILSAPMKSGKTTMIGNLIRSLADGVPFLGEFETHRATRVALIDDEMDRHAIKRWLRDQGIQNKHGVVVVPLRGLVGTFDILDPHVRAEWAAELRALHVDVVVFDCLRPLLDALGLSEDKDAGKFLVAFDSLLKEAGVSEAVVVHHTGHEGSRSRGDSRIRDWPDAEWRIKRDTKDDHGPRTFSAFGRDVDVYEGGLAYDPTNRHLTYTAGKGLIPTAADKALPKVLQAMIDDPGITGYRMRRDLKGLTEKSVTDAAAKAVASGLARIEPGPRKAECHYITETGRAWLAEAKPSDDEYAPLQLTPSEDEGGGNAY